ncbi:rab3 GTPase-activating protein non-catalytic subunit-like isoform X2 [Dendronephthya gigantea]|uniref:rab3 GTPase-activating protein non-catalytic subunit-like isoform X2 n=1 Tax=Dendronephthya gigantea TaxID=151771 RepID=UPI0010697310|nr:rab3 GTPase-activating protein non-catalytic subunit-like isoform X2 [Dendronephthya gigantea]
MSTTLTVFACIENVERVISCLYQANNEDDPPGPGVQSDATSGDEEWSWESEINDIMSEEDEKQIEEKDIQTNWLQDCCIGVSPCEDLIAIGREDRMVILTAKWDRQATSEPKTKFQISWTGQLALEEGECVSSLLCLPLASQHKSSQGFPDWTCIVAGFTSGYIRFYLEDGSLLLHQLLHEDPVIKLKCQTWQPGVSHTDFEQVEELAILYPASLVLLDGFSLYQSLRGCRNQLARAQASGTGESIKPPPLAYKKWNLKRQRNITDIASCGMVTSSLFDHLKTASFMGGCDTSIRSTPPAMSQFMTSGTDPFIGVYSALEGVTPPLISEVAFEVATKLTSAVLSKLSVASDWFGWTGSKPDAKQSQDDSKNKPKVEKGTSLPLRFSISDQRREGMSITLSPDGRLAATTDEFGRVMLISVKEGIVLRTWKGYRDAECAWVPVLEDHHDDSSGLTKSRRTALFLIIYAPRRGILEVWTTEFGPRAAAFNVGRDSRFLYIGHHILGLSHVMSQSNDVSGNPLRCVLLQASGNLKILTVPFHCALSDKYSRRVRDLHLLKKLSAALDHVKQEVLKGRALEKIQTTVLEILTSIQVPVLLQQGLQCVLSTVGLPVSLLEKAVSSVSQNISKKPNVSDDHEHEDDCDIQALVEFTKVQGQIINTFMSLCQEKKNTRSKEGANDFKDGEEKVKWLVSSFTLSTSEANVLLRSLESYWKLVSTTRNATERSNGSTEMTITKFLSCFEVVAVSKKKDGNATTSSSLDEHSLRVRKNLSSETLAKFGDFLYDDAFTGSLSVEKLCLILDSSSILPTDLLDLLMSYWLSQERADLMNLSGLCSLHNLISSLSSLKAIQSGANEDHCPITAWWEKLRHQLAESAVTFQTLSAAVCCRSVVLEKQVAAKKLESDGDHQTENADWVSVSLEMERWNLLVNQLEDILNVAVFCLSLENGSHSQQEEHYRDLSKCLELLSTVNVLNILDRGQSGIPEIVAKCVARNDISPDSLGQRRVRKISRSKSSNDDDRPEETIEEPSSDPLLEGLPELRKRFPHSLAQDVLWAHCVQEYLNQWLADKERPDVLQRALNHAACINDQSLQHGLCVFMWRKVQDSVSALTALTEKVGKAPKERLCLKTVRMGCTTLTEFLKFTRSILQFLAEITRRSHLR